MKNRPELASSLREPAIGDMEHAVREILRKTPGLAWDREGLAETPARFVKAWAHFTQGYTQDPSVVLKTFEDGAEDVDEMVVQRNIPLWSLCEHHLLPFWGHATIAYIPSSKILGLSKFTRLVDVFARRLQVQERLTVEIATALENHLAPRGVGVSLTCRHSCMESRGVCKDGETTTTTKLLGVLRTDAAARAEFLRLVD